MPKIGLLHLDDVHNVPSLSIQHCTYDLVRIWSFSQGAIMRMVLLEV